MLIGEFARRSGVSVRMLRYYEGKGLLQARRTASGYRNYREDELEIVARITLFNTAGLTLETIRRILPCTSQAGFMPCAQFRNSLSQKLADIDGQIEALRASRNLLVQYLEIASATAD